MKVNFVTIRIKNGEKTHTLDTAFGKDYPIPLPLEGEGLQYVFCLNIGAENIIRICEENNFEIMGLIEKLPCILRYVFKEYEIDNTMYNSEYKVVINYDPSRSRFELEY